MGRTTLRRILVNAGLSSPRRRRPPKHRVRRQRMPREGMLIQMDGSYHRWLGEDGPQPLAAVERVVDARAPGRCWSSGRTAGTFQDRLITELRLAGATTLEQAKAVLKQFLPRFDRAFWGSNPVPRAGIPAFAAGPVGAGPVLQAPQESGQGQHREVPEAHPVEPQLRRNGCGGPGGIGRPAISTP